MDSEMVVGTRPGRREREVSILRAGGDANERVTAVTTVKAKFDGRVSVPEEPVDLPVGYELEIAIEAPAPNGEKKPKTALQRLAEIASQFPANPDLPSDYAAQIDHYLYGLPKRD